MLAFGGVTTFATPPCPSRAAEITENAYNSEETIRRKALSKRCVIAWKTNTQRIKFGRVQGTVRTSDVAQTIPPTIPPTNDREHTKKRCFHRLPRDIVLGRKNRLHHLDGPSLMGESMKSMKSMKSTKSMKSMKGFDSNFPA